jgi:hypothetical protein
VYVDRPAVLEHLEQPSRTGSLERYMDLVEIDWVDVVGDVSAEAPEVLTGFGANFFDGVASISK